MMFIKKFIFGVALICFGYLLRYLTEKYVLPTATKHQINELMRENNTLARQNESLREMLHEQWNKESEAEKK